MAFISTSATPSGSRPSLFSRIAQIFAVRRQRSKLAKLDSRALEDIGLTEADVQAELRRSAWDVPAHWKG
ncbi:DUF1127 domain-containing protein [Shimia sp. MMG029]|uniref:DUF1127 domain-containing protein n=1 Tax=Shimia sp. MMG029 TaxID=3021978 RepID=UPI0022FDCC2E|nr:DUF1127 domain-containing protein [Shimia sp. MMG029]MDA5557057.1 DUF1127 domain-containing protein [Shimia sp. MMG029]